MVAPRITVVGSYATGLTMKVKRLPRSGETLLGTAGLATALAAGVELEAAVRLGVVAGGLAVTKEGVVPAQPSRDEILRYYEQTGLILPNQFRPP